jgi:threonine aldolase
VQTNIVIFHVDRPGGAAELVQGCAARKVKMNAFSATGIRWVTHKDVDTEDVDRAIAAVREIAGAW